MLFLAMKPSRSGFYVDVGAYAPVDGSNTYKLYRNGWKGVTIEPNPRVRSAFRAVRGRDTHLTMGVSKTPAELKYFQFEIAMLNTMDEPRADALRAEGYIYKGMQTIACDRLEDILAKHAPGQHVDLLSVDCEGFDMDVIQTIDFKTVRPTAVIIEDLAGFGGFRDTGEVSEIKRYMLDRDYAPIAQTIYSTIYVARDWRALNARTGAFTERMIQPGMLPEPV